MLFAEIETGVLVGIATFISIVSGAVGAVLMKVMPVWQANRSKQAEDERLTEAQTARIKKETFEQVSEEYQAMLERSSQETRKRDEIIDKQGSRIEQMFQEIRALTNGHADCLVKNEKLASRVEVLEARLERIRVSEDISNIPTRTEALIVADENGVIREWNQAATLLLHWSVEEAVGNTIDVLVAPRWLKQHNHSWKEMLTTGRAPRRGPYFVHARNREGKDVPVEMILSGWQVDGKRYFSASLRQRVELPSAPPDSKDVEQDVPLLDLKANPDPLGSGLIRKPPKPDAPKE
jgi:PAS domain S-box-containing protein